MSNSKGTLVVGHFYPALNGARGLAVILVLWFHTSTFGYETNPVIDSDIARFYLFFSIIGKTGVDLFFVLSGFLITGILIDTAQNRNVFKSFYIRRALRIFPLYYLTLFVMGLFFFIKFDPESIAFHQAGE